MAKKLDENLSMGVDVDGDGKPDLNISLRSIGLLIAGIVSMAGMWFTLKADIALAMEKPDPPISQLEFKYKDDLIRKTIELTQKDVAEVKDDVKEIKETLSLLEERLYEIKAR